MGDPIPLLDDAIASVQTALNEDAAALASLQAAKTLIEASPPAPEPEPEPTPIPPIPLPSEDPIGSVRIFNDLDKTVDTIGHATLPFPRAVYHGEPLQWGGKAVQVEPFGARWPDGSIRFSEIWIPPQQLTPQSSRLCDIDLGAGVDLPFKLHPAIIAAAKTLVFSVNVGEEHRSFGSKWSLPIKGPYCFQYINTMALPELEVNPRVIIRFYSGCPFIEFSFDNAAGHFMSEKQRYDLPEIELEIFGGLVKLDDPACHPERLWTSKHAKYLVSDAGRWGNQAPALTGTVTFDGEEAAQGQGLSEAWRETLAAGPWGWLPDVGPDKDTYDELPNPSTVWEVGPDIVDKQPPRPGNQEGFGYWSFLPLWDADNKNLRRYRRSILREGNRQNNLRGPDGKPFDYSSNPSVVLYKQMLDTRFGNALGKTEMTTGRDGWQTYDPQHINELGLIQFAITTGHPWAMQKVWEFADLMVGELRSNSGTNVDNIGASRQIWRELITACWLWIATGREDLAGKIRAKVDRIMELRKKWLTADATLRPCYVYMRPPGAWGPEVPIVEYWQEFGCICTLDAVWRLFDYAPAKALLDEVSVDIMHHGLLERDGKIHTLYWQEWQAGPVDPASLKQELNSGFTLLWALSGVMIAMRDNPSDKLIQDRGRKVLATQDLEDDNTARWLVIDPATVLP